MLKNDTPFSCLHIHTNTHTHTHTHTNRGTSTAFLMQGCRLRNTLTPSRYPCPRFLLPALNFSFFPTFPHPCRSRGLAYRRGRLICMRGAYSSESDDSSGFVS